MLLRIGPLGLILSFWAAATAQADVTLKVVLDPDNVTYRVFMNSSVSYNGTQAAISTSQITLSVPHGTGPDQFLVTELTSPIPTMRWTYTGRAAAPVENPDRDYLFFSFINNQWSIVAFDIMAGQDYLLFQFKRKGNCLGSAQLYENESDEFKVPNSMGINVGNQLSIVGAQGDAYRTNNDALPSLSIAASAERLCAGESVTLTAVPSMPPVAGEYSYQWFADGVSLGPASPSPVLTYTSPPRTMPSYTSYSLSLRVKLFIKGPTTCLGQFVSSTKVVMVNPRIKAALIYTGDPCAPLPVLLSADVVPGATYQWVRDGFPIPGETTSVMSVTATGNYAVRLDLSGCTATSPVQSIIGQASADKVTAVLPESLTMLEGTSLQLMPQISHAVRFRWSPQTGLSSLTEAQPLVRPVETTTYSMTAYGVSGCPASASVLVEVIPGLRVPSAFTPNSDGQNDRWTVLNLDQHPGTSVAIYDRWGRLVYRATDRADWDGLVDGELSPGGVYQYVIQSPYYTYHGKLFLIR